MSCPIRPKVKRKFLLWTWMKSQDHEWVVLNIGVHMAHVSNSFKVEKKCRHCNKWQMEHFVEHEELLRLGFTQDDISTARCRQI